MATLTADETHACLEGLWSDLDTMFGDLGRDDWHAPHGADWTFSDVPFHLSYFDDDLIADGLQYGAAMPPERQTIWADLAALNAWNARHFAARPADASPEANLDAMHTSRERVRQLLSGISDGDLDAPAFWPVFGGWMTVGMLLDAEIGHTWNHVNELRWRLEREGPLPSPEATHIGLRFYTSLVPLITLDPAQARQDSIAAVLDFPGAGGGAWTVRAADGACGSTPGADGDADLTITHSAETYLKLILGMTTAAEAMASGEMTVDVIEQLPRYRAIFPGVEAERPIRPMGSLALN